MSQATVTLNNIFLITSTAKAYLVRLSDGDETWIPKSLVEYVDFGSEINDDDSGQTIKEINTIEIAEWFAEQEGLI